MQRRTEKSDSRTEFRISLTLWVKLNFRSWQWAHLLRVDPADLEGRHHWIYPAGSVESRACKPLESLRALLDYCQEGRRGAGLVNLDLASEIDEHRERCQTLFAQGVVMPHAGDRNALEEFGFDTTACRWFTTQITPGEAGENWRLLLREFRIEAAHELVHQLHDAANFLGTLKASRGRQPNASWARVAAEVRADYDAISPNSFNSKLVKVQSDLQKLVNRTVTPLLIKGDLPANELEILVQLVRSLESALLAIARITDTRSNIRAPDPAANLDADLTIWNAALNQLGRIQL